MFVYYEQFKGATQAEDVTEVVISSNGRTTQLNWSSKTDEAQAILLVGIFKEVPFNERIISGKPYFIWTFLGVAGNRVIQVINTGIKMGLFNNLDVKEIKNLTDKTHKQRLDAPDFEPRADEVIFKEEEFFYSAPSGEIAGEELWKKLAEKLGITLEILRTSDEKQLKKYYRVKALEYHPDRNNGDGSRMSELNMLMRIYQGN